MKDLRIATAQFEHRDGDKVFNLSRIEALTRQAVEAGAQSVSFHEGCIPAYSWLQPMTKSQLADVAEPVPDGPSVTELIRIAREYDTIVMAGLIEQEGEDLYNTYVTVSPDGYLTRFRKLHPL